MANETSNAIQFSRLDAVKQQLEMAVRARLQFEDLVSAMTLAGAAERVLSDRQPKNAKPSDGFISIKALCNEYVVEDSRKEITAKVREAYDQLRHADKKPNHIHRLDPEGVDAFLLMTIYAYARKPQAPTDQPEATVEFAKWFNLLPPILGAFTVWMFLNDPRGEKWISDLGNDPSNLRMFRSLPVSIAFEAILQLVESKSLIPNP